MHRDTNTNTRGPLVGRGGGELTPAQTNDGSELLREAPVGAAR